MIFVNFSSHMLDDWSHFSFLNGGSQILGSDGGVFSQILGPGMLSPNKGNLAGGG